MARPLSPAVFAREVERRLIGSRELARALGLLHRQAVWERVRAGTLPPPVITQDRGFAFWDRDALDLHTPTRKES